MECCSCNAWCEPIKEEEVLDYEGKVEDNVDETLGRYHSVNYPIILNYNEKALNGGMIKEENNKIYSLIKYSDRYQKAIDTCSEDEGCVEIEGVKYNQGAGVVKIFDKNKNDSLEESILALIEKENKDSSNCKVNIQNYQFGKLATIELVDSLSPTNEEVEDWFREKSSINHNFSGRDVLAEKAAEMCSTFTCSYGPCIRHFLYNDEVKDVFVYFSTGGWDASLIDQEGIKIVSGDNLTQLPEK